MNLRQRYEKIILEYDLKCSRLCFIVDDGEALEIVKDICEEYSLGLDYDWMCYGSLTNCMVTVSYGFTNASLLKELQVNA